MDKIERLIKMMDQPDRHSREEWQEVLADKECREYYRLMCDTAAALNGLKEDGNPHSDTNATETALRHFQQRYMPERRHYRMWRKVAAGFAGLLLVSGIAFATITIVRQQYPTTGNTNVETPLRSLQKAKTAPAPTDTSVAKPQAKAGMRQFVDVSAGEILKEIAAYYGMKEETSSRQAANTRLYFNWNKQYNVEQVVEQLNQFEHIHITVDGDNLVLEAAGGTDR